MSDILERLQAESTRLREALDGLSSICIKSAADLARGIYTPSAYKEDYPYKMPDAAIRHFDDLHEMARVAALRIRKESDSIARRALSDAPQSELPTELKVVTENCPECGSANYRTLALDTDHRQCNDCEQEWWADIDYRKSAPKGGEG